jgi:pimeloyl-ACP methyl ester carboxylesterase
MNRRSLVRRLTWGLLSTTVPAGLARGQDLGKLLERAARDSVRKTLTPENLEKALTPRDEGVPAIPIKTPDGWTLVAHRYKPVPAPRPGTPPVILCHGLTYSAAFWDLDPSVSFARWLARQGYDVWAVDLRGCGMSQKWVFRLDDAPDVVLGGALRRASGGRLAPTGYASVDPRYANWTLDDHINHDVPTLVRLVRKATGAPEVCWIGHSMGGIVALGHLSRYQNPGIGRLVTVGSQVTMQNGQMVLPFLEQMLLARQQQLVGKLTPEQLASMTQTSVQNLFFNVQHVSPKVYEALSSDRTDIPAIGLMKQYTTMAMGRELLDARKQFNYARALGNVQVPVLMTCGAADQFAPPPVQKYLYDHVGSSDKTALVFGRARGFAVDSGHDDALVGLTSREQVYPVIERWLRGERLG